MREVCQCARCDREDVCRQLSAMCQSVHVTATETLRRERMCANSGGVYGDNVHQIKSSNDYVRFKHDLGGEPGVSRSL